MSSVQQDRRPQSPDQSRNGDRPSAPQPAKAPRLAQFFFLETIFAILLSILMVVGGVLGYLSMTKQSNPDIVQAIASQRPPAWERPISAFPNFDWASIGASVIQSDAVGPSVV
ncbi:MAG: hypothetical protein F6K04_19050, partial [Leptolyngbya sp. SIO4C5]|nr:hypothetical protein [Leptolyngbya sp. SIO4C5]